MVRIDKVSDDAEFLIKVQARLTAKRDLAIGEGNTEEALLIASLLSEIQAELKVKFSVFELLIFEELEHTKLTEFI